MSLALASSPESTRCPRRSDAIVGAPVCMTGRGRPDAEHGEHGQNDELAPVHDFAPSAGLDGQPPPRTPQREPKHDDRDRHRHHADIERGHPALEIVDLAAQGELHVAQLRTDAEQLRPEALDGLELIGRQHVVGPSLLPFGSCDSLSCVSLSCCCSSCCLARYWASASASMRWISSNGRHDTPRPRRSARAGAPDISSTALITKSPLLAKACATAGRTATAAGSSCGPSACRRRRPG